MLGGTDYNPLFLYGPAGVGKTHLMWAAYGAIASHNPNLQLLYITIEEFYKTFVDSVRKSEAFTTKYRNVDVLLIDDIQFLENKEKTQDEFFHTFNTLKDRLENMLNGLLFILLNILLVIMVITLLTLIYIIIHFSLS